MGMCQGARTAGNKSDRLLQGCFPLVGPARPVVRQPRQRQNLMMGPVRQGLGRYAGLVGRRSLEMLQGEGQGWMHSMGRAG